MRPPVSRWHRRRTRSSEAEAEHARAHDVDPDVKGDYEPGSHRERESEIDVPRQEVAADDRRGRDTGHEEGDVESTEPVTGDEYEERRVVREGDPDNPDVVREERVREDRLGPLDLANGRAGPRRRRGAAPLDCRGVRRP